MIHYRDNGYTDGDIPQNPLSPAFRYGAGFFETVLHNGRETCHLDLHLDRLLSALRAHAVPYETVDFETVIAQVLERNSLLGRTARVNIFYPMGADGASPVVTAAPYEPKPYKAYRLCLCEDRHVSALNGYKTTSHMFFHLALLRARERGFDDAALFDLEDNLLESTTGALILEKEGHFVCADSPYRLPSVALDIARRVLNAIPVRLPMDELPSFRHAYVLNSLIGMRPVVSLGETGFVPDGETCDTVSEAVLLTAGS